MFVYRCISNFNYSGYNSNAIGNLLVTIKTKKNQNIMKKHQGIIFLLLISYCGYSQIPDIDPRQFIQIYEKRHTQSLDTLWLYKFDELEDGSINSKPYKKHLIIDNDTELEISFNYDQLLNNINTIGNFTLTAFINKTPIELAPFSEIGEEYRKIGLSSKPPFEIATNLIHFLIKSMDATSRSNGLIGDIQNSGLQAPTDDNEKIYYQEELNLLIDELELITSYLSYFNDGGIETTEAFLKIIGSSNTRFEIEKSKLLESITACKDITTYSDLFEISNLNKLVQLNNRIAGISNVTATKFEELLNSLGYGLDFLKIGTEVPDDLIIFSREDDIYSSFLLGNTTDLKNLAIEIAKSANSSIYSKLVKGSINLKDHTISDGDILSINLNWSDIALENDSNNSNKPISLPITSFKIVNTGWTTDVVDQTSMINRLYQNNLRSNYPLSPSKFKPTAGISLLWSYKNTERNFHRNGKKVNDFARVIKWLEMSIGVNVSYVDFDSEKTFELGIGPVVGLFNNKLFFNYGYNLHANNESPFYFGVGISFANIISEATSKN